VSKSLAGLLTALFILLAGCAPRPSAPILSQSQQWQAWQMHRDQLTSLQHWQLTGRIAIFNDGSRQSGRISWRQQEDHSRIAISSMFGTTLLQVDYRPARTEVIDQDGQRYVGADGAVLIQRLTGWRLPLAQLPAWIKGLPLDADFHLDGAGWLAQLSAAAAPGSAQAGWEIQYHDLRQEDPRLPQALTIESGQLRIKLAINQWIINPGGQRK